MRWNYLVIGALLFAAGCSSSISSPFVGKWDGINIKETLEYQRVEFKADGTLEVTFKSKQSAALHDRGKWKKIDEKTIEFTADSTQGTARTAKLIDDQTMEAALPFKDPTTFKLIKSK